MRHLHTFCRIASESQAISSHHLHKSLGLVYNFPLFSASQFGLIAFQVFISSMQCAVPSLLEAQRSWECSGNWGQRVAWRRLWARWWEGGLGWFPESKCLYFSVRSHQRRSELKGQSLPWETDNTEGEWVMVWLMGREARRKAKPAVLSRSKSKVVPWNEEGGNFLARRCQHKGALGTVRANSPISFPHGRATGRNRKYKALLSSVKRFPPLLFKKSESFCRAFSLFRPGGRDSFSWPLSRMKEGR